FAGVAVLDHRVVGEFRTGGEFQVNLHDIGDGTHFSRAFDGDSRLAGRKLRAGRGGVQRGDSEAHQPDTNDGKQEARPPQPSLLSGEGVSKHQFHGRSSWMYAESVLHLKNERKAPRTTRG